MTADIVLRAGDERPVVKRKLTDANGAIDLTGTTVNFRNLDPVDGTVLLDEDAEILAPPTAGDVQYRWETGAAPAAGVYFADFKVTAGAIETTIPNSAPLVLLVTSTASHEYSYTGDPNLRPIDAVRFLIRDTDTSRMILTDKEVEYLISENGNIYAASADAAMMMSSYYTNLVDKKVGPLSISYGDVSKRLATLSVMLRERAARKSSPRPINTAKETSEQIFDIGMHDYPGSLLPPWQANEVGASI